MAGRALEKFTTADDDDQGRPAFNRNQRRDGSRSDSSSTYRRGYRPRRKVCAFCADKTRTINWKVADSLRRFVNDGGGIHSRRKTGTCARHQRRLAIAIKRARYMALLPYTVEHVRIMSKN